MTTNSNVITVAAMIVLLTIGIGIGWGVQTTVVQSSNGTVTTTVTQSGNQTGDQGPYSLTLVITTANSYNSTIGEQPAYYVLTPHGLESSANIALPVNRLIELTIVNYDDGNANLTSPAYANVQGTVNGTISYVSNSNANSTQGTSGIVVRGAQTVSSVAAADIAHTFTIPSLGINIPVPLSSTVTTFIKIDKAGTYTWFCETVCGSGPDGLGGAMSTPGWMTGDVVATASAATSSGSVSSSVASPGGPYALTLVETMQDLWNSSGVLQPKFFVLGNDGLESSANIALPVNRQIQITIVSYDTPEPAATNAMGVVSGTIGGTVYLINGTIASGTANMTGAMAANWGKNVTAIPASQLAHTFTIQQLGISIPVVGGSTVMAYIEIHQTGTFTWMCLTPCGLGSDGMVGAMDTPGWMTGNVEVS